MASRPLQLIAWPYHAGLRDVSMGLGASFLAADDGFRAALEAGGCVVSAEFVPPVDETLPEVARIFELDRRLARRVAAARARGARSRGARRQLLQLPGHRRGRGRRGPRRGVARAPTPTSTRLRTNRSGFTDVMGLAILDGRAGGRCARRSRGSRRSPRRDEMCSARCATSSPTSASAWPRRRSGNSGALGLDPRALAAELDALARSAPRASTRTSTSTRWRRARGAREPVRRAGAVQGSTSCSSWIDAVCDRFTVAAAALTAYDPRVDDDGALALAARRIAGALGAHVAACAA